MVTTVNTSRDFDVQQFTDTVQGVFAGKNAFMGSSLVSQGAVIVNGEMPYGRDFIGNQITIPYFGVLGEFDDVNEDVAAVPKAITTKGDTATVARSALAFEVSRWAQHSAPADADPYVEAARQVLEAATRKMDALIVTAAAATPLVADYYSSTVPSYLDWDKVVDARAKWGDRQDAIVGMIIHSRTEADLRKLRDNQGRPLLLESQREGDIPRFCGVPLIVSDRVPVTGSTMTSPMAESGTNVDITLTGTPLGPFSLKIVTVTTGTQTTGTFKFSTDGGQTYSANLTRAATVALVDTAKDSLVGLNGATGLTAAFAAGTYTADESYTSTANFKTTSLIVQKGALSFWYNRGAMALQTDRDILKDNDVAAMHMYRVAHLYRRRVGGVLPGVVGITHNVRNFIG